jgi:hypothetical protein
MINGLSWEGIVRFVNICGTFHNCLWLHEMYAYNKYYLGCIWIDILKNKTWYAFYPCRWILIHNKDLVKILISSLVSRIQITLTLPVIIDCTLIEQSPNNTYYKHTSHVAKGWPTKLRIQRSMKLGKQLYICPRKWSFLKDLLPNETYYVENIKYTNFSLGKNTK